MTVAVGCDLVALAEIEESVATFGERYLQRVFTSAEVAACRGARRIPGLAARFAAKEALVKALAITGGATPLREIEVVGTDGPPRLELHGTMGAIASANGVTAISVSLSHCDCHAMAVVTVERDDRDARAAHTDNATNAVDSNET